MPLEAVAVLEDAAAPLAPEGDFPFNDLLVPHDRPIRPPLPEWAQSVNAMFQQASALAGSDLQAAGQGMSRSFNEAALIEVYFGRPDHAAALCRASIDWFAGAAARSGDLSLIRFALQAFVNLGRLDRIAGRWELALSQFEQAWQSTQGVTLRATALLISNAHVDAIGASAPEFLPGLETIYVVDSLKTLLKAKRYADVLDFVQSRSGIGRPTLRDFLWEAAVVATYRLGRGERSLHLAEERLREPRRANRPIFILRRAEVFTVTGHEDCGLDLARKLGAAFEDAATPLGQTRRSVLDRLIKLLLHLNAGDTSRLAARGATASAELNDVPLQSDFLTLLMRGAADAGDRAKAAEQLAGLRRSGWYGAAAATGDPGIIDQLFNSLMSASPQ
jgi:hypothetical protein